MHFVNLCNCLHKAHKAVRAGPTALNAQAVAINDLFLYLDSRQNQLFPSLLYTQANQMLHWYREHLLPELEGYNEEDRQEIAENYRTLIASLNESAIVSQNAERAFYQVIQKLVTGTFHHEHEVEEALLEIARNFPGIEDTPRPTPILQTFLRRFKSVQGEFNYTRIAKLFERLVDVSPRKATELSGAYQANISNFREMFENVLHSYFEGKALLVDSFGHGIVMPLWVSVDCSRTSEHVEFWNHTVDTEMQTSADIARSLARKYLLEACDREISERVAVQCQFPNPAVGYRDTSASVLIGMKIVGEVLGLESDPTTAVTGEVEHFGNVLGVGWIPEKVNAASEYNVIDRILVPEANLREIKMSPQEQQMTIVPVRTFAEALQHYYGNSLRKKKSWLSRRRVLEGAIGVLAIPIGLFTFKNIFTHPVTDQDLWNVEYATELYQKQGDYQKALEILQFILKKFHRNQSSTETLQIQAQAFKHLGVMSRQQNREDESLYGFRRAFELWKALRDRECQVDMLLRIGGVYLETLRTGGTEQNRKEALSYFHKANDLLSPSMKAFQKLRGRYYTWLGDLYYWIDEYDTAAKWTQKGLEFFDETDKRWGYQVTEQHLGRIFVRSKKYDEAYEILERSSKLPVLQGPYDQAKTFWTLGDLFFSIGEYEKGLEFAGKAGKQCKEFGLKGQSHVLTKMLVRHQLPSSFISSL